MKKIAKTTILASCILMMVGCASQNNQTSDNRSPTAQRGQHGPGGRGGQVGSPSFSQLLSQMDSNGDSKLSKSEVKGPLANDFARVDSDEDGFITESELENAPKPLRN
ncbi:MAG: EF-hand domain-containing protein [Bacteroidota bacterium]